MSQAWELKSKKKSVLSTQEILFTLISLCLISDVSTNKPYNKRAETFHLFLLMTSTDQTVLWHHAMLNHLSNPQDRRGSESERDLAVLEEKFEGYAASEGVCFQRSLSAESSGMFFIMRSDLKPELKSFHWPPKHSEGLDSMTVIRRSCWVLRFQSKHNATAFKPSIFFHYLWGTHWTHIHPVCFVISSKLC